MFRIDNSLRVFVLFMMVLSLFVSCNQIDPQSPETYIGKHLKLDSELMNLCGEEQTVLAFFDLRECFSCQAKELNLWTDFLKSLEALSNSTNRINVVFVMNIPHREPMPEFVEVLLDCYPVRFVFDSDDFFKNNNILPQQNQYHCFLLNERGRIELIGKPIYNSLLYDNYLKQITSWK